MFNILKAVYPKKPLEDDWILVDKDDFVEKEAVLSDEQKNNYVLEAISRDIKPQESEWKTVTSKKRRKQKAF